MRRKLAVLLPYYGELPKYFSLWLDSLSHMTFEVICFTDLKICGAPRNLIIKPMTLEQIRLLAVRKLGVQVNLTQPYKLCDLKPMYGKIFEDYIKNYDYWAFGDCDLLYGRSLNQTLEGLLNRKYDIISFREKWISGGLTIMKNVNAVNLLFKNAQNLGSILASCKCEYFDELGGKWFDAIRSGQMRVEDCGRIKDCFASIVWSCADLSFFHKDIISEDLLQVGDVVTMIDGHLYRNDEEIDVFHYVECKSLCCFSEWFTRFWNSSAQNYKITRYGVFSLDMEWRCRFFVAFARRALVKYKHFKYLLSHARRVGVRRTLKSFFRQLFGGISFL